MFDFQLFLSAVFGWPLFEGAIITLFLCLGVQAISFVIALAAVPFGASRRRGARALVSSYVWLLRGTPALLVLLFIWNGLPQLFPVFRSSWFSPFLAAFIALTLIQTAYLIEILRSAFIAVPVGQREGAQALGLRRWHIFCLVILPQALRIATPALVNEMISLLKTTSLASVISLSELMTVSSLAIATSFKFLEWYSAILIYYLAIVGGMTVIQSRVEKSLAKGYQR